MERYRQFNPIILSDFETGIWHHPVHNHNHYEIIYIKKGLGRHFINEQTIRYQKGDIFLLGPEEEHYFEIDQPTRFIYLKFTDLYVHREHERHFGVQQLEYLIRNREARASGFSLNKEDRFTIEQIFDVIISLKGHSEYNETLIWLQVITLSVLLRRNLPELRSGSKEMKGMQSMFCYVHENIYTPAKLKAEMMARHFNISAEYVGPYFKRNTGITLRAYIQEYRNGLIRKRIKSGNYSLKQIATEFGLTDESHVTKLLNKINN